jgi:hypothetical protein
VVCCALRRLHVSGRTCIQRGCGALVGAPAVEWNWLSLTDCGCQRPSHVIVSLARNTRRRTAAAFI